MMKILSSTGDSELATVFTASFGRDQSSCIEFVDAKDPLLPRSEKWVIIVSTQLGCPIACRMCDSGGDFRGNLSGEQIMAQIDHAVEEHQESRRIDCKKFKVQFARMGEPSLNPAVFDVLKELPRRYDAPGLIPCVATVMPEGTDSWFNELLSIKQTIYRDKLFQLQISINSTDQSARDWLMPYPKWSFAKIARYGESFAKGGHRKISLNFAWTSDIPIESSVIARHFNPNAFCIKITPLNPTLSSEEKGLNSAFSPDEPALAERLCEEFARHGYETILSIGDTAENEIGSNCGMSVHKSRSSVFGPRSL
jgi:23S rRNA (adenine2503-C2)-methyltransferase